MRLLVVSSDLPLPTRGGGLMLHRLLDRLPGAEVAVAAPGDPAFTWSGPVLPLRRRRWFTRLRRTRLGPSLEAADWAWGLQCDEAALAADAARLRPDAVLTVAYGGLMHSARRLAARLRLPLVAMFMDWWPDFACQHLGISRGWHARLEHGFLRTHRASRVVLGICPEMLAHLGGHPGAHVLYPPARAVNTEPSPSPAQPPTRRPVLAYIGLATGMYADNLAALATSRTGDLRIYGPAVPPSLAGVDFRGFVPDTQLDRETADATALLVTLPFAPTNRRLAQTSFSSKFSDYCARGRPIVVWGPADAAVVRFARERDAALVICDEQPLSVWRAVGQLAAEAPLRQRCVQGAADAFRDCFAPDVVRRRFLSACGSLSR